MARIWARWSVGKGQVLRKPPSNLPVKRFEINGFRDTRIAPGAQDPLLIGNHGMCGNCDDWNTTKLGVLPNPASQKEPILTSKLYVQQDDLRWRISDQGHGACQVLCRRHVKPFHFQPIAQKFTIGLIVFHYQYSLPHHDCSPSAVGTICRMCLRRPSCHWLRFWKSARAFCPR